MDVAASVVGLLLAASTAYTTIDNFISACTNAPDIAQEILAEVRDFEYALTRLRARISKREEMTPLGAMATDATQLAVTLASCTLTFSQLERIIDGLMPKRAPVKEMSVYSRLRWTWENSNLTILVRRIQQHKATLTLLLTIWMSESSAEAESMVDSLNDILETLTTVTKAIPALATPPTSPADLEPSSSEIERLPTHLGTSTDVRCSDSTSIMSVVSRMSFTALLRNSRPYRNRDMLMPSSFSLSTSQRRGTQWSTFSIGSNTSVFSLPFTDFQLSDKPLAEESSIYKIRVPMKHDLLFNEWRYPNLGHLEPPLDRRHWMSLEGRRILSALLHLDDPQIFKDMISYWTTTNAIGTNSFLHYHVAMSGGENLMKAVLDSNSDTDRMPLLHGAVRGNNEVTLRVLLAAGADPTIPDLGGRTCLDYAKELGMGKILAILSEEPEKAIPIG
ncbi:uncharacterized protein H6S33_007012 [Morchella sextelata]|uniref:uncharacterized protein n=1 Tax=Morchella sextelata TaxID=1174677 RepID=UPI001D03E83F|nr:uncharacterized protein H6S33_007012 [Morchella sextelata]KAH0603981.1 hypothetical protein H6S33_007012 [Morchella sextelata]